MLAYNKAITVMLWRQRIKFEFSVAILILDKISSCLCVMKWVCCWCLSCYPSLFDIDIALEVAGDGGCDTGDSPPSVSSPLSLSVINQSAPHHCSGPSSSETRVSTHHIFTPEFTSDYFEGSIIWIRVCKINQTTQE